MVNLMAKKVVWPCRSGSDAPVENATSEAFSGAECQLGLAMMFMYLY